MPTAAKLFTLILGRITLTFVRKANHLRKQTSSSKHPHN